MDELKITSPGFDYCIKKDPEGRPTGLMYMTAQMRYHARRYGSVQQQLNENNQEENFFRGLKKGTGLE